MSTFTWVCPHCQHSQTGAYANSKSDQWKPELPETDIGRVGTLLHMKVCLNQLCKKITLYGYLYSVVESGNGSLSFGTKVKEWPLIPESAAKPQPDFIPKALRDNYIEACRIRDLSPKASATLSRRCLQGMIRDFCGISKGRLIDEIKELRSRVDTDKAPRGVTHDSVDAIDSVRGVGNIGAHMEKDIDLIIDIDPGEAQLLIDLIETLFDEWYVARDTREKRFAGIKALGEAKASAKKPE